MLRYLFVRKVQWAAALAAAAANKLRFSRKNVLITSSVPTPATIEKKNEVKPLYDHDATATFHVIP